MQALKSVGTLKNNRSRIKGSVNSVVSNLLKQIHKKEGRDIFDGLTAPSGMYGRRYA
jgi:hypothetical protein